MENLSTIDGKVYAQLILNGANSLNKKIDTINNLNVFPVPDGDTGTNMMYTMQGGVDAICDNDNLSLVASAVAKGMLMNARGNSGVILSQFFYGIAKGLTDKTSASVDEFLIAIAEGVKYAYKAVVNPVEGTILTVAREGMESVEKKVDENTDFAHFFHDFTDGLKKSLDSTPQKLKVLKEAGVVDSGGAGLLVISEGFCNAVNGEQIDYDFTAPMQKSTLDFSAVGKSNFGYCTELLIKLLPEKEQFDIDKFIQFLSSVGDSVVAFETDGVVKTHVHTKTPEVVLAEGHKYGEFITLKIENMDVQHSDTGIIVDPQPNDRIDIAYVVVGSGEGMKNAYIDCGAHYVVDGGQTNNPSTEDFIKAFDIVNADNIFVLPNNKNIVLAAMQAKNIYEKSNVIVINTTTPQQVYTALIVSGGEDVKEIESAMNEAVENVQNLSITYAVRDSAIGGVDVKKDDYIGFCDGALVASSPDKIDAIKKLLACSDVKNREIATVFYGKDITEEEKEQINDLFAEFEDIELVEIDGDQQVYSLLIGLE